MIIIAPLDLKSGPAQCCSSMSIFSFSAPSYSSFVMFAGAFCDLVWSDPEDLMTDWAVSPRGAGWLFGNKVTNEFMEKNNLKLICRAHQLVHEGQSN